MELQLRSTVLTPDLVDLIRSLDAIPLTQFWLVHHYRCEPSSSCNQDDIWNHLQSCNLSTPVTSSDLFTHHLPTVFPHAIRTSTVQGIARNDQDKIRELCSLFIRMYDRSTSHLVPLGDLCATFGIQSGSELLRVLGDLKLTEKVSLEEGWGGEGVRGLQTREEGGVMEAGSVVRAGGSSNVGALTYAVRLPALDQSKSAGSRTSTKAAPVKAKAPPKKKLKTVEEEPVEKPAKAAKPAKGKKASKKAAPESLVPPATALTSKLPLNSNPMSAQDLQELDKTAQRILATLESHNNLHGYQVFHTASDLSLLLATLPIDSQLHLPPPVIEILLSHLSSLSLITSDPCNPIRHSSPAAIVPASLPLSHRPLGQLILHLMVKYPTYARRFSELGIELGKKGVESWVLGCARPEEVMAMGVEGVFVELIRQEMKGGRGRGLEGIEVGALMAMLSARVGEDGGDGVEADREWAVATFEELYAPMIRDLDTLLLRLSAILGSGFYSDMADIVECEALSTEFVVPPECLDGAFRTVARWLACSGQLKRDALNLLRGVRAITSLDLTRALRSLDAFTAANSLAVLGMPCGFFYLTSLCLAHVDLSSTKILLSLGRLRRLNKLDLTNTRTSSESIDYLTLLSSSKSKSYSPLTKSLEHLRLADNPLLDDAALPGLHLLSELITLDLVGTSISLRGQPVYTGGLHFFILKAEHLQPSLIAVSPPDAVRTELSGIVIREIEHPMIANPDLVKTLTVQKLKYNLRYQNKRLLLRGSKVELVQRLSWVLYARLDNMALLKRMGARQVEKVEEVWA